MEIAQYDPLAINSVILNVKKAKKYSSVKTILLSLIILGIVFAVNWEKIEELNKDRRYLETLYQERKSDSPKLTTTLICICASEGSPMNINVNITNLNQTVQVLWAVDNATDRDPNVAKHIEGKQSMCYDFDGIVLRPDDIIFFEIMPENENSTYQMYMKVRTVEDARNEIQTEYQEFEISFLTGATTIITQFIEIIYKDSWKISYEPEVEATFSKIKHFATFRNAGNFQIKIENRASFGIKNSQLFIIQRTNIGDVIARIIAWKEIILLLFIYFISPYLQSEMKMDISKKRYESKYLDSCEASIGLQIKRRLSSLKKGMFRQQILSQYYEKIEKDLDLVMMFRKFIMFENIVEQSKLINKDNDDEFQYFQNLNEDEDEDEDEMLCYNKEEEAQFSKIQQKDFGNSCNFEEMQEEATGSFNSLKRFFSALIRFFDYGASEYNIVPNGGKGHGSIWNLLFLFLTLSGMIVFLILIGLFQINDEVQILTLHPTNLEESKIILKKNTIAVNYYSVSSQMTDYMIFGTLIDSGNIVEEFPFIQGEQCHENYKGVEGYDETDYKNNSKWACLNKDIELFNFKGQLRVFEITFKYKESSRFKIPMLLRGYIYNFENQYRGVELKKRVEKQEITLNNRVLIYKKHVYQNELNETEFQTIQNIFQRSEFDAKPNSFPQISFKVDKNVSITHLYQESIWDILDNAWGLIALLFELIIIRVSMIINSKFKKSDLNQDEEVTRTNVLFIMANNDRLTQGTFKDQIQSIPCYQKYELKNKTYHSQ